MHIHVSALEALVFTAYLVIIMFLLRSLAVMNSDNTLGKALNFIIG